MNAFGGQRWFVVGGVILVVALGGASLAFFMRPVDPPISAPAPVAAPEPVIDTKVLVKKVSGSVERLSLDEEWTPVQVGESLKQDEALRTSKGSSAELAVGDTSVISLAGDTTVAVVEVTGVVEQFALKRGRLSIDRKDTEGTKGRTLRIEGADGQTVATKAAASFRLARTDTGFAVATTRGSVNLAAAGETVEVAAGQQASTGLGTAPSAATPISTNLLLRIGRYAGRARADTCTVVEGRVEPGQDVTIDGEPVKSASDGAFRLPVPRTSGKTSTTVVVEDAFGNTTSKVIPCTEVPKPADIDDLSVQWGKKE